MSKVSAGEAIEGVKQDEGERTSLLEAGDKYAVYRAWAAIKPGQAISDTNGGQQGFVAIKVDPRLPAPTIAKVTASVPSAYGPMHWSEKRKFTVPELKRFCSFPDGFRFPGDRERAAAQLGNCVCPVFMSAVAFAVAGSIRCGP